MAHSEDDSFNEVINRIKDTPPEDMKLLMDKYVRRILFGSRLEPDMSGTQFAGIQGLIENPYRSEWASNGEPLFTKKQARAMYNEIYNSGSSNQPCKGSTMAQSFIPVPAPRKNATIVLNKVDLVVRNHNGDILGVQDAWIENVVGESTAVITREGIEELFRHMIRSGAIDLSDFLGREPEDSEDSEYVAVHIDEYFNEALTGEPFEEVENDDEDARS